MSASHIHPRRRPAARDLDLSSAAASKQSCVDSPRLLTLRKGATFHPASLPSSTGPALYIPSLLRRSPTSPQTLLELISANTVSDLIDAFNKCFVGSGEEEQDSTITASAPFHTHHVPTLLDDHRVLRSESKHLADFHKLIPSQTNNQHASDSGIGSSISESNSDKLTTRKRLRNGMPCSQIPTTTANPPQVAQSIASSSEQTTTSVYSAHSAITRSFSTLGSSQEGHCLDDKALDQIKKHIVEPILAEEKFKEYHPLIREIPSRIKDRTIDCLRDLEKTLIFVTPVSADFSAGEGVLAYCFLLVKEKSSSAASYRHFCETAIQCIHTAVTHLGGRDLCRPTDRPYTNTYFLDLHQQIQHYARIIAEARQKQAEGKKSDVMDYSPSVSAILDVYSTLPLTRYSGEKLQLRGGLSKSGTSLELVREKDGKIISLMGRELDPEQPVDEEEELSEESLRSMGRKRKCDIGKEVYRACRECGKEFKRPCDLTKHEKTHSRPWKCPQTDCKYHENGWPTEKERDRHVNDKHSSAPSLFKCLYSPCPYSSKRESNCKQHMEKAHDWEYVRSKSKKGQHLVPTQATPSLSMMPTPSSGTAFPSLSTPRTPFTDFSNDTNMDVLTSNGFESPDASEFRRSLQVVQSHSPFDDPGAPLFPEVPTLPGQQELFNFGNNNVDFLSPDEQLFPDLAQHHQHLSWPSEPLFNGSWMPTPVTYPAPVFQQPTPPWSNDMQYKFTDEELTIAPPRMDTHLTPNAQPDLMFTSRTPEDEGFVDGNYVGKADFSLFGGDMGNISYNGESSAMGAMFYKPGAFEDPYGADSIYDATGGQFQMDNTYLGDSTYEYQEDL